MSLPVADIVKGHINELMGNNEDLQQSRLEICKKCPIYSPRFGGICNDKLYLNPHTNDVSRLYKTNYIQGCGCRLLAKTTLPEALCIVGKW